MILVSHPTGNNNVRAVIRGLNSDGLLAGFATTLAINPSAAWLGFIPNGLRGELLRRAYPGVAPSAIHAWPWRELVRLSAGRLGLSNILRHEVGWASVDAVYRDLDLHVATHLPPLMRTRELRGVYAYEDGALATFQAARRVGLRCFYDQPIGHWKAARRILAEEAGLQPEWASTLAGNKDSSRKLDRKNEELALADEIFVASSFTLRTLIDAGVTGKKIHVIPYGAPSTMVGDSIDRRKQDGPLRVLFVGSMGQRKGLSYLLKAIEMLGPKKVELTLIGQTAGELCQPLRIAFTQHRHIRSLPHTAILDEMRRHDVFVFPSLFEGFGLVLLEAMSQGLPVITTAHTAGPDIITEGREGFIVPIRSPEAIAEKLQLLHDDRDRLHQMRTYALQRAQEFSWINYEKQLVTTLRASLESIAS
jgi:alpha-maltose-1-phosphate synthase